MVYLTHITLSIMHNSLLLFLLLISIKMANVGELPQDEMKTESRESCGMGEVVATGRLDKVCHFLVKTME